jgi:PIN domain nuclease of toxin-antitoxin system
VRLLLDTHVLIWATIEPLRLGRSAVEALEDESNELILSSVSAYEIEYKRERDPVLQGLPRDLNAAAAQLSLTWLDVTPSHAAAAGRLPKHHGDPFDRILIAQGLAEGAAIITLDRWFAAYGLPVIW